jgi:hypothetical protein
VLLVLQCPFFLSCLRVGFSASLLGGQATLRAAFQLLHELPRFPAGVRCGYSAESPGAWIPFLPPPGTPANWPRTGVGAGSAFPAKPGVRPSRSERRWSRANPPPPPPAQPAPARENAGAGPPSVAAATAGWGSYIFHAGQGSEGWGLEIEDWKFQKPCAAKFFNAVAGSPQR